MVAGNDYRKSPRLYVSFVRNSCTFFIYTHKAKHDKDKQNHIAQQSHIHYAQMTITTTTIHTQCTNDDYNNNYTYTMYK